MDEFVQSRADAISESPDGARACIDKLRTASKLVAEAGGRERKSGLD
jgi:hypothetical protein